MVFTTTTIIILFGIANIILYLLAFRAKKRKPTLGGMLNAFLNGFVPYGTLAALYSGFTGKQLLAATTVPFPDENYRVILITAGISLGWLYYHLFIKTLQGKN